MILLMQTSSAKKHDVVQVKNPKTDRYVKIDRTQGRIVGYKLTPGPYKSVPVVRKSKKSRGE